MIAQRRGPWQVTGTREVYKNPWMRIREDQVIRPNGTPGIYGVVEFTPAVGVVAMTPDERVYLVGQYRYPMDEYSWEIITGYSDAGENLLAGAARELREEAGLTAQRWTALGRCHISNSVTDQVGYLYLAQDLEEREATPDETEDLAVKTLPLAEALAQAQASAILQGFSLVGLYRAWHYLRRDLRCPAGSR
ncbi:MAG: NUDIX domain-containing protein [Chloroflexota bacterium]